MNKDDFCYLEPAETTDELDSISFFQIDNYKILNLNDNVSNFNQLIQSYSKGGFQVTWMEELTPDPTFEIVDKRGYNFAKQFPLWHLFELTPKLNES